MNVLLDTCVMIWTASDPESLSELARETLTMETTSVHVSPITCAELCCLQQRNRIRIEGHWKTWFNVRLVENGWSMLDITLPIVQEAYSLPDSFHRDPVDRLLVGTARVYGMPLVTSDDKIRDYPHVDTLW